MVAFKSAKFTDEQAEIYAKYLKAQADAAGKSKADKLAKDLKAQVVAAFGDELFATLPDGTVLQRSKKERDVQASEARKDSWWDISKVQ